MAGPWEKYAEAGPWSKYAAPEVADTRNRAEETLSGILRGAAGIGNVILSPMRATVNKIADTYGVGQGAADFLNEMNAAPEAQDKIDGGSNFYKGGRLAAEVGMTLPVGGAVAQLGKAALPASVQAAPWVANALEAIGTSGMRAGSATGPANMLTRAAGGAVAGGASAGLVDPSQAGTGAVIGGAAPGVLQLLGKGGQAVGSVFRGKDARAGSELARALDANSPAAVARLAEQLREGGANLVPGSAPNVAQVLQTPQAGILQRVVSDSSGGRVLRDQIAQQNAARIAALERVAQVNPLGVRSAQQDMGEAVARYAIPARQAVRAKTSALYSEVPQEEAMLYLPELAPIRDKYFGPAVFGERAAVDRAVSTANQVGTTTVPGIMPTKAAPQVSLLEAVKRAGGINQNTVSSQMLGGEVASLRESGLGRVVYKGRGQSVARMAEKMHEAGYIPSEDPAELLDLLRSAGRDTFSGSQDDAFMASAERAMGDMPGAQAIPQKVSLKDFEDLRKSIGGAQRAASMNPERATEAKALADMKTALDARIDEVVRGDGRMDEVLPLDWADKLTAARKSKADEVARFGTGPQAAIFRKGSDGQPLVQGGEVAAKFWGNRPGLADDVKSFRRLIDDNPRLLGQFKSMVATEGASTQTAAGNLTGKFAAWVDNSLPGLKEAFNPDEVKALQRIAADVRRAEKAAGAGMARGSNTYQNAQNALSLGLLDNKVAAAIAGRVPGGRAVFDWGKEVAGSAKARRLADYLADPAQAANALEALGASSQPNALQRLLSDSDLAQLAYRAAPVTLGAR